MIPGTFGINRIGLALSSIVVVGIVGSAGHDRRGGSLTSKKGGILVTWYFPYHREWLIEVGEVLSFENVREYCRPRA